MCSGGGELQAQETWSLRMWQYIGGGMDRAINAG